ncbi:hypothetical protein UPYG_G00081470 [Umbra pygmaea]|uniref:Uncharacterized protein n=1 Tax=Umbra pygmaea TaxID=75934 RepID=A0ABD0XVF2_UMBPY
MSCGPSLGRHLQYHLRLGYGKGALAEDSCTCTRTWGGRSSEMVQLTSSSNTVIQLWRKIVYINFQLRLWTSLCSSTSAQVISCCSNLHLQDQTK